MRWLSLLLLAVLQLRCCLGDGFVEEVACFNDGLTVVLNRSDAQLAALMNDPKSQPVVYVFNHKHLVQCGTSLKNKGAVTYNLTIKYGKACDVYLTNLEPNYRTSEMAIVLENNIAPFPQILNQVHCVYTRNVQTFKFSDVSNTQSVAASTGGRPRPKVDMHFRSISGMPLREARFGEVLEFYLTLIPDNAYTSILPKMCRFSDREDMDTPEATHLTFVQNSCNVKAFEEIIEPLSHVNNEVFFTKFKTFRFENQSTVFVHCTVQVCMSKQECEPYKGCFKQINNSNLTGERLKFRHRRDTRSVLSNVQSDKNNNEEVVKGQLRILNYNDKPRDLITSSSPSSCPSPLLGLSSSTLILFTALLGAVAVASLVAILFLLHRLKKRSKEASFELYTAAQLRSMAASTACLTEPLSHRFPQPLHVNTDYQ